MTPTVFFSWQSDSKAKLNTDFIRSALEEAIQNVAVVELPLRVDAAAEGVSGTPRRVSSWVHLLILACVSSPALHRPHQPNEACTTYRRANTYPSMFAVHQPNVIDLL